MTAFSLFHCFRIPAYGNHDLGDSTICRAAFVSFELLDSLGTACRCCHAFDVLAWNWYTLSPQLAFSSQRIETLSSYWNSLRAGTSSFCKHRAWVVIAVAIEVLRRMRAVEKLRPRGDRPRSSFWDISQGEVSTVLRIVPLIMHSSHFPNSRKHMISEENQHSLDKRRKTKSLRNSGTLHSDFNIHPRCTS